MLDYIFVSMLWGLTNPFIKRGAQGVELISEKYKNENPSKRRLEETKFLITRYQVRFFCKEIIHLNNEVYTAFNS